MATVVSATTRSGTARPGKSSVFISRASILLRDAVANYAAGHFDDALELAYQAALRTAGACIAQSTISRRRRLPAGAWKQLALVDSDAKRWASRFEQFSTLRSRVINGLDSSVDAQTVAQLIDLVGQFLDEVEDGGAPDAIAA